MSGIQIRIVIDTNMLFMAIYNEEGKAGKILQAAAEKKLKLFAPISVKEELKRILQREFNWSDEEIEEEIKELPVAWIEKEIYEEAIGETIVKHKPDKSIEALALVLDCSILTADKHFDNIKRKININDLLAKLKD